MKLKLETEKKFRAAIIAQDDDCDYDESGWVAVVQGRYAGLAKYGHCSCYGTWTSVTGGNLRCSGNNSGTVRWDWQGTVAQLVKLAKAKGDPHLKGRTADPKDYDYDHLMQVYTQVLSWNKKHAKK